MKRTIQWVVAAMLLLAACTQGDSAPAQVASLEGVVATDAAVGDAANTDVEAAMLAMAQCMRDNGVQVSDPEVDADGSVQPPRPVDSEALDLATVQEAREACAEHLEGIDIGFRSIDQTELQDTLLAYAACMRENGFDMPDPDASALGAGPGQGPGAFGEIDRSDPDFIRAQEACQDVLGDTGFRGPGDGPVGPPGGGQA